MTLVTYEDVASIGKQYFQIQQTRIAANNRLKHLPEYSLAREYVESTIEKLKAEESYLSGALTKLFQEIAPPKVLVWQQNTKGIGIHLLARLVADVGDPVTATPHWFEGTGAERQLMSGEPYVRTPQQLFRFCGYGAPEDKRRKGMPAEDIGKIGRPIAKSVTRLLVESCMKAGSSPYRPVYDAARAKYATREGWTLKHQHNSALRKMARALLLDLWLTAQGLDPIYGQGHQPGKYRFGAWMTNED